MRLAADQTLDLRGLPCPLNYVRAKLRLTQLAPGTLLEVWLDGGEPAEQVPESLAVAGYQVEAVEAEGDYYVLQVRA